MDGGVRAFTRWRNDRRDGIRRRTAGRPAVSRRSLVNVTPIRAINSVGSRRTLEAPENRSRCAGQSPSLDRYVATGQGRVYLARPRRRYVRAPPASRASLRLARRRRWPQRRHDGHDDDGVPSYLPQAHPRDLTAHCISNDSSCVVAGERCGVPRE